MPIVSIFMDEANPETKNNFTVCGATVFNDEQFIEITRYIEGLRVEEKFVPSDQLKSSTGTRPKHVSSVRHREIKNKVLNKCAELEVVFFGYCKFNSETEIDRIKNAHYGFNTLLKHIHDYVEDTDQHGTIWLDRSDQNKTFKFLKDKFGKGNEYGTAWRPLDHFIGYNMTSDGTSHAASVNDILLGSLRYIANETHNSTARISLLHALEKIMWSKDGIYNGNGLMFRPLDMSRSNASVRVEYDELRVFLNKHTNAK